ncbi:GNAT family N-acetyltransferase [Salinicola corii]|uniref:GNAT family N-acetyltransferase n=1 Tax=Salinicola corii TaxID=2606937 RepID=A0A640WIW6_9GAMM|nr:GNAT family protein [Salinicola corii]KAA0020482.1 GNAT family N-acetyltransferase [Salinicola corii]
MMKVEIFQPGAEHRAAFLAAVQRSESLLGGWVSPPDTPEKYADYLRRYSADTHYSYLARTRDGNLVGCINLNEIVRGALQSAYLGYHAFSPNQGKGLMKEALSAVISSAFGEHELHRLEANIQSGNVRSVGLAKSMGFRLEGYSPRYLKIDGEWRDHERYAITSEDWAVEAAAARDQSKDS